jgi:hypothetical protein
LPKSNSQLIFCKDKATIVGVAAHFTAASPGGPKIQWSFNKEQKKDIENGNWLSVNCSTLIDKGHFLLQLNHFIKYSENEMNKQLIGVELKVEKTAHRLT